MKAQSHPVRGATVTSASVWSRAPRGSDGAIVRAIPLAEAQPQRRRRAAFASVPAVTLRGPGLLDLPPRQGACRLALAQLETAVAVHKRLDDPKDAEALHDFRVALRRLRSVLRAYSPWLEDAVPVKWRRRLRRLARATNDARDAEVMLAWLDGRRRRFGAAERAAYTWLRTRLAARRDDGYAHARRAITKKFVVLERRMRKRFAACADQAAAAAEETFGNVTGILIGRHHEALTDALKSIGSAEDSRAVHVARIAGKRLRYLLEPVAGEIPGAARAVAAMKSLQNRLGALCDAYIRMGELIRAAETAGGDIARFQLERKLGLARRPAIGATGAVPPGLFELARRAHDEIQKSFSEIDERYLGRRAVRSLAGAARTGARLATGPRTPVRAQHV